MPTSRRRPQHDLDDAGGSDDGAGPPARRRRARPAPSRSPIVPIAVGAGVLLLVVVVVFVMQGGEEKARPAPGPATLGAAPPAAAQEPPTGSATAPDAPGATYASPATPVAGGPAPAATPEKSPADDATITDGADGADDVRAIDPQADFPGLEEIQGTVHTYMVREFLLMRGKPLNRAERAAEIARWNARRKVVEARIAEAADDPFLEYIDYTRNKIATLPYFDKFQYDVIESTRPYALFVELKGESVSDRDERREQIEKAYGPFLEAYDQTIHRYLMKLAPVQLEADPTFIVFILLDRASYDRFFQEFEKQPGSPGMRAHYNWVQKWAFTYSPELKNASDPDFGEGTQALLHEITHAWVSRLATDDDGRTFNGNLVQTHWFNEGIAEFMSCHFQDGGTVRFQPWKSMRLAEVGARPPGIRIPLQQGFKIGRHDGLAAEAARVGAEQRASAGGIDPGRAAGICMSGFYADMSLFIFWLNYGNDGKYKRTFEDYVRKELSGRGGPEVAEKVFADVFKIENLEQVIDDFQKAVATKKVTFSDKELAPEK